MRKVFKYLIRTVIAIFILLFLVIFLLYLPPIQNFLKEKAVHYITSHYDLVVKVGHFRLGFPLDLVLEDVYAGQTANDTLISAQSLHLKVGLRQIFRQQLSVDELTLRQGKFRVSNDSTGMDLKVAVRKMDLRARHVDLRKQLVEADYVRLDSGDVILKTGDQATVDTTGTTPLNWIFVLDRIEIREVGYQMNVDTLPFLSAGVKDGRIAGGKVALGMQTIGVDSVDIAGGWCRMMARTTEGGKQSVDATESQPWEIRVGAVGLENSAFSMSAEGVKKTEFVLSGIGLRLDSVYNRGMVVKAGLRDLKAVQKEGIEIVSMQANVDLDTTVTSLEGAYIRTQNSWVRLDVQSGTSVQHLMERIPLSVSMTAQVGLMDVLPFYQNIPLSILHKKVNVNTSFSITEKRLQLGQLILDMKGHFKITGSGSLSAFRDFKQMRGSLVLRGEFPDVTFVQSYLRQAGIQIPRNMDMLARLKSDRGHLGTFMRFCCGEGCLTLDAAYGVEPQAYAGELTLNNFPLDRFLPADSLGKVSAAIRLTGHSYSWSEAKAEISAHIREFTYRRHDYQDIFLNAGLNKTRLQGTLSSKDQAMPLDLIFKGDSVGTAYTAMLSGRIGIIDLEALHFAAEPLTFGADIDIQATMDEHESYSLKANFDSLKIADAYKRYSLGNLALDMNSDEKKTELQLISGDLKMEFQTDTSLMAFSDNIGKVAQVIQQQIQERNVEMELVKESLPPFSLQLTGARENAVARFLKSRGIGFRNIMFDVVSRKRNGIRLGFQANAPYFGTVRLDSVQLGAWQTGQSLMYSFSAGSSSEAWKGLFNVSMTGRMQGDRFRVELKQKDAAGKVGFDLGVNSVIGDSTITVSFFPMNPILGYSRWIVNAENKIVIGQHGKIRANLRMAYLNKLISIQSLAEQGDMKDRLQVEIAGVDLAALSQMVPFMPDLSGKLNTNLWLYSREHSVGADGNIQLKEFTYADQRIGTVDLGMQYAAGNGFTDHAIDFELKIDSIRRAVARGAFFTSDTNRNVVVDVDIPSLPLYIVNAFVPADLIRLSGDLIGNMHFRGTVDAPSLNGDLAFKGGKADVVMLGTTFGLDTNHIRVEEGKILFRKYRFIAPNNSDMVLNGEIALTPFDKMYMDLDVNAANFEVVNVRKNETSLIYGKAYADIHSRIAGPFSGLSVTGNINLLNRTAITYTLRSSGPELVDKSEDLVRFVSFRDSTLNEQDEMTNRIKPTSFALKMLIEIGDQVNVGVDLSEDGSNHVTIQGGGNLVLAMNPESGMTLSGKYILSGGTVVYNVPIAGKKEFNIQNGSYVEWTGNVMNPILSISASEQVKATVEDGDRNRLVTFESIIRIQNTLSRPDITFDLAAPNDMVIQNQLATFSQEERTRQALNLLIYNTYTAPGAAKSGSTGNLANNAIYGFVENELNKYTRKAGITLGVDSYNTDENTTRTDYTYQFSRQLFNDRIRVKIGGRISTDNNETQSNNIQDNLVDDISIEYVLTKKRNLYVKVFRHSNYESVLDGEVTQTGVGIVWRKNFRKFKDLFKNNRRLERESKMRNQK